MDAPEVDFHTRGDAEIACHAAISAGEKAIILAYIDDESRNDYGWVVVNEADESGASVAGFAVSSENGEWMLAPDEGSEPEEREPGQPTDVANYFWYCVA